MTEKSFEVTDAMVNVAIHAYLGVKPYNQDRQKLTVLDRALKDAITAAFEVSGILEENARLRDENARLEALIPLADAVLDHADKHCRAFPIATAPRDWTAVLLFNEHCSTKIFAWSEEDQVWTDGDGIEHEESDFTSWAPIPSETLPEVFTQLGQALEKIKGGG